MKYQFDKYQWATLVLRVKNLFSCGEVPAITRMMESGINLPVMVKSGKVVTFEGGEVEQLESIEIEVDETAEFEGRSAKDMRARHERLARFIHAIDEHGDVSAEDIGLLSKGGKTKLPPPVRPPVAMVQMPLPGAGAPSADMDNWAKLWDELRFLKTLYKTAEDNINQHGKRLLDLEQAVGAVRQQAMEVRQVVSQARLELADLREKVKSIDTTELTGRINNLVSTHDTAFEQVQNRLQEVEQTVAAMGRVLREKHAVDRAVKSLKEESDGGR